MARPKKTVKKDDPIKLWLKPLKNGNKSIYLRKRVTIDGKTYEKYENLNMKLVPEESSIDRVQNREVLRMANVTKSQRVLEFYSGQSGVYSVKLKRTSLLPYIKTIAEKHLERTGEKEGLYYNLLALRHHLKLYAGQAKTFQDIDKNFVLGFINYLGKASHAVTYKNGEKKALAPNTVHKLYRLFKNILNRAERAEIIERNPCDKIDVSEKPKPVESKKNFLTIPELKKLIATACEDHMIKQAFLFCCLTGIRFSDAKRLKYNDIRSDHSDNVVIEFRQQKTKGLMYLPISDEALKWVPNKHEKNDDDNVFILPKNDRVNATLKKWCALAGITKHITFHCSRHTSVTLSIALGNEITIVSKLHGHAKLSTTQQYVNIMNEAKVQAVAKQNNIFD